MNIQTAAHDIHAMDIQITNDVISHEYSNLHDTIMNIQIFYNLIIHELNSLSIHDNDKIQIAHSTSHEYSNCPQRYPKSK